MINHEDKSLRTESANRTFLKSSSDTPFTSLYGEACRVLDLGRREVGGGGCGERTPGCSEQGRCPGARREPRLLPGVSPEANSAPDAPCGAEPNLDAEEPPAPHGADPGQRRESSAGTPHWLSALPGRRAPAVGDLSPCGARQATPRHPRPGEWAPGALGAAQCTPGTHRSW